MKVLLTGGTGWVGKNLVARLDRPVVTSRNPARARRELSDQVSDVIEWDAENGLVDLDPFDSFDTVVNLMGEPIADGRWNEDKKKRIADSRIIGTQNLVESILKTGKMPRCFVSASAIGYYGDRGEEVLDESASHGSDFLAELSVRWEAAARPLVNENVRVVWLRIGIVLGRGGGALDKMLPPFRKGLGGRLGTGKQWISWVHMSDLLNLIAFSIKNSEVTGPVNAVSPNPVRNAEFTKQLGKALRRPTILPVPKVALQMALGEFSEFLCASQRVVPGKLSGLGFRFQYTHLEDALQNILASRQ